MERAPTDRPFWNACEYPEILAWSSVEPHPIARIFDPTVNVTFDRHKAGEFATALGDASAHGPNVEMALVHIK